MAFIEPHGISREAQDNKKVQFHKVIKEIETRLKDQDVRLESFIVTPTPIAAVIDRGLTREEWADRHVLFMDSTAYVEILMQNLIAGN